MAKTNFSKVEQALEEGLRRMSISKLCDLADIAAGIGFSKTNTKDLSNSQIKLVRQVQRDLDRLVKKDKKLYVKLKLNSQELEHKLSNPDKLTENEWKGLEVLRKQTKKMIEELFPDTSDEEIIEQQKVSHVTRRFNVNNKWLPLQ